MKKKVPKANSSEIVVIHARVQDSGAMDLDSVTCWWQDEGQPWAFPKTLREQGFPVGMCHPCSEVCVCVCVVSPVCGPKSLPVT